ncbi:hypothetical protein STRAU_7583 [Streptomyces aurantiacus JA 4570]|uniref:Uncharacterized protein n=1 Tax=Streptomyces aurantiacus JA 4570 TaxID=1286094 RepID=S3Z9U0_9ACTN|nr:hypothetical protein STRAU_7583 [Streptomyces aurantiacus JA 4570]
MRGDVVRGRRDGAAGGEQGLVEQGAGALLGVLAFARAGQGRVQRGVRLLHPAQGVDRVVRARGERRPHLAASTLATRPRSSAVGTPSPVPPSSPRASARSASASPRAPGNRCAAWASSPARRSTAARNVPAWSTAPSAARRCTAARPLSAAPTASRA